DLVRDRLRSVNWWTSRPAPRVRISWTGRARRRSPRISAATSRTPRRRPPPPPSCTDAAPQHRRRDHWGPCGPSPLVHHACRMGTYIEGRDVNLTFRPPSRAPVPALRHFDIDVDEGEFLSIVGPSGCGKSTFLNVLLGLLTPDSGALSVDGKRITGPGTDRA